MSRAGLLGVPLPPPTRHPHARREYYPTGPVEAVWQWINDDTHRATRLRRPTTAAEDPALEALHALQSGYGIGPAVGLLRAIQTAPGLGSTSGALREIFATKHGSMTRCVPETVRTGIEGDDTCPTTEATAHADVAVALRRLLAGTEADRDSVFLQLATYGDPQSILATALSEYSLKGNTTRLSLAASVLGAMGKRALGAFEWLAHEDLVEAEFFASSVPSLSDVPRATRIVLLNAFASSRHECVRDAALDALATL